MLDRRVAGDGAQTLSLDAAPQTAFANNPDLAAAQWEIDIASGGRQQAGLIPNPLASWDAEDTRRDTRTTTLTLSQTLELGGKRGARIELATRGQDVAALTLQQRRNDVRAEVIERYYGALRAQERLELAQRSLALAERGLVVANGRVSYRRLSTGNTPNEPLPPLRPVSESSFTPTMANASRPTPTVSWVKPDSNLPISLCDQASE